MRLLYLYFLLLFPLFTVAQNPDSARLSRIDRTGHVKMPEHLREVSQRTIDAEIERRKTDKQNTNP